MGVVKSETALVLISGPDSVTEIVAALAVNFDVEPRFYCTDVHFSLPLGASLIVNLGGRGPAPESAANHFEWDVTVDGGAWRPAAQLARCVVDALVRSTSWALALHFLDGISAVRPATQVGSQPSDLSLD